jgi:peptidoglycan/xylan/chitin deacetylase (PgdA/CDA1 family)
MSAWLIALSLLAAESAPLRFAVARVRTNEPVVALTFDACATKEQANGFDRPVYEILQREQIPATIFMAGRWIENHPDEARELASQDWLEIANHSYSHARMPRLSSAKALDQITSTNQLIEGLGRKPVLFRSPAGAWTARTARLAARQNLTTIQWDVVSGDAGGHVKPERMVQTVLAATKPGSIVIFHINERGPYTKDALPEIIAGLRERGLRFVTVSQLLALDDGKAVPAKPMPFGYRKLRKPARQTSATQAHEDEP